MRIAIIGKGTSAIITSLVLLQKNHDITIFYDPSISPINVGESTTPHIQKLVYDTLGISVHDLVDMDIFSYKMGINFVNWGCGNQFHHNFVGGTVGHHFETQKFNEFIHGYLKDNQIINYVPEKVKKINALENKVEINDKEFDFVVNCSGWENNDNYISPFFHSVNSAQLFVDNLEYDVNHTLHLATEDGWQFGLPFPQKNIFKCGYLYNSNLISHNEVKKKIKKKISNSFSWTPRYSKELIVHPSIALNGNRLFFLEPLQALGLYYTYYFAVLISHYLDDINFETIDRINYEYNLEMWTYQLSLAYHYQYGSTYKTKFWETTQNNAINVMKSSFNGNKEIFMMNLKRDMKNLKKNTLYSKIGVFGVEDLKQIHFGMVGNS